MFSGPALTAASIATPVGTDARRRPLLRIFGIEIVLDAGWFVVMLLMVFTLAVYLGQSRPDLARVQHLAAAAAGALLFSGSILAHELAHSLMARLKGIGVHRITLFAFGGYSWLKRDSSRPRDEFEIAGVGPLTSAAIGGLFLGAQALLAEGTLARSMAGWLGSVNLALAIFNLLPGLPLDGGRLLRAAVWKATGSRVKATRWASRAGTIIAGSLVVAGILIALQPGAMLPGFWITFVGMFLYSAARAGLTQSRFGTLLSGIQVGRAMRAECGQAAPGETVDRFVEDRLLRRPERCYAVRDERGALAGVVTPEEVIRIPRERWDALRVADIMVPLWALRSVSPQESLREAVEKMDAQGVDQLPVAEGTELLGLLTREDVVHFLDAYLELKKTSL